MPEKFTKDDKEIDVYTEEEVKAASEAAEAAAIAKYKEENPDKSGEITKLTEDLAKITKDFDDQKAIIEGGDSTNKQQQIDRLRRERDDEKESAKTLVEGLSKKVESLEQNSVGSLKGELLNKFAGEDKDIRAKIEVEFANYRSSDNDPEAIRDRMEKAFKIVTGSEPTPEILDNIHNAGKGVGSDGDKDAKKKYTEGEKKTAKALGITEKQMNEFGPKKV